MNSPLHRRPGWAAASLVLLGLSSLVAAEPPSRAARLGYVSGTASFSPAGQRDWVRANVNRPLTTGDRLWTDASSRAEVQIGGAAIRMGPSTSTVLLNLDNRIAQVQLSQGTLNIRVRSLGPRQTLEVATPNLAFTLRRPGSYRIEVDPQDDATAVLVRTGEAEVYGEGASYTVNARRAYRFYGTDLSDYETLAARRDDALDQWSRERDRRADGSVSARYVSSEVVGYEDLDAHGSWRVDASFGPVWTPTRVASGWTPYRDGHWSWVDPWGWTWVDDAPWGYAVSHYGRWANISNRWAWVPGPRREQAVYAPALVAFIGGKHFQGSASDGGTGTANVGWFPLAPREVYQPAYPVSRSYFDNINRSNAVIAPTTISKVYNTTIVNHSTTVTNVTNISTVVYANQQVSGAVVAVPAQAFVQSQPVARAAVALPREAFIAAPVMRVASVAPLQQSVQGGASEATAKPPVREHAIVARTAPPPAPLAFAAQQAQLAARPGTPIDEAQRTRLKPAAPAVDTPKVSVVAAAVAPTATALPPVKAPGAKSPEARKVEAAKADGRRAERAKPDAEKATVADAAAAVATAATAAAARAEAASSAQAAKVEASKAADAKSADAKAAALKAEAANKAAETKDAVTKADDARAEAARRAATGAEAASAAAARALASRASKASDDAHKAEVHKAEVRKADEASAEFARGQAAKADASKADALRADAVRAEAAKAAHAKAESAKAESAKAEAAKAEAAKASEDSAARTRGEAAKAEALKAAAARAEAAKVAIAKADLAKGEAAKAEASRANAARVAKDKAETAKADAARAHAAQAAQAAAARKPHGAAPESPASAPRVDADADARQDGEKAKKNGR